MILADYRLREEKTGVEAITAIVASIQKDIPAILITGDTDPLRLREAQASGYHLLHKPVAAASLRSLVSYQLANSDYRGHK